MENLISIHHPTHLPPQKEIGAQVSSGGTEKNFEGERCSCRENHPDFRTNSVMDGSLTCGLFYLETRGKETDLPSAISYFKRKGHDVILLSNTYLHKRKI